jgi:HK97 family phage prohead protease
MHLKPNDSEIEVRSAPLKEVRVETNATGGHSVSGYAIVFNSESVDLGGFTEIVAPNALARTLIDNPDVLCLRDHKQELLLGRTISGTLTLKTDDTGLYFTCSLPATSSGNDLAESLRRGDIDSCSFGMVVVRDAWSIDLNGNDRRTLLDIDVYEISIVSFPAYEASSASLRSAPVEVRTRINAKRNDDSDTACLCACPSCQDGDCANCSDPDCDLETCSCDNEERSRALLQKRSELNLRLLEMSVTKL